MPRTASFGAAADQLARGFLIGATAGRTTLTGEGTQHMDGHSPMLAATNTTLAEAGIAARPETLVADAGYWRIENVNGSIPNAPELFIAVAKHARRGKPRKDGSPSASTSDVFVAAMKATLTPRPTRVRPAKARIPSASSTAGGFDANTA